MLKVIRQWLDAAGRRRDSFESDMSDEMRFHMEEYAADLVRSGLSADEAARRARLEFGGMEAIKEDCRTVKPFQAAGTFMEDLGSVVQRLRRAPAFSLCVALIAGLGIAATSAVLMLMNATLWRPLPFDSPERVGLVWAVQPKGERTWLSFPEFEDIRRDVAGVRAVEALTDFRAQLLQAGEGREIEGLAVSHGFLRLLGVPLKLGRDFTPEDDTDGSAPSIILGYSFWKTRFGGDPHAIGSAVEINERPYRIVGVLPESFSLLPATSVLPDRLDVLVALRPNMPMRERNARMLHVLARLQADGSFAQAGSGLAAYGNRANRAFPSIYTGGDWTFQVTPFVEFVFGKSRTVLLLLLALCAIVLLTACFNVTALFAVRGEGRRREFAIRSALGAGQLRLSAEVLAEVAVLAIGGAAMACLLLSAGMPFIQRAAGLALMAPDWRNAMWSGVGFCLVMALAAGLVSGVGTLSAMWAQRISVSEVTSRGSSRSGRSVSKGRRLMGAQIALACASAVMALCLLARFRELQEVDLGFRPQTLETARVTLSSRYADNVAATGFVNAVVDRLNATAGIRAAGAVTQLPLSGTVLGSTFLPSSRSDLRRIDADLRGVTPGYFEVIGSALLGGRGFTSSDSAESPKVAIVDEAFARRLSAGANVVGQRIRWFRDPDSEIQIVGVVRSVRHTGPADAPSPTVYRPITQYSRRSFYFVARTVQSFPGHALEEAVGGVDRSQPVADVSSMEDRLGRTTARIQLGMIVACAMAGFALLLSASGVYGVVAFEVWQRHKEFGIRTAIGATPSSLVHLVVRQAVQVAAAGAVVGLLISAGLAVALRETEFAPSSGYLPASILGSAGVLALTVAAAWLPAVRAGRTDPREALQF